VLEEDRITSILMKKRIYTKLFNLMPFNELDNMIAVEMFGTFLGFIECQKYTAYFKKDHDFDRMCDTVFAKNW
jgi:hypothetical protein